MLHPSAPHRGTHVARALRFAPAALALLAIAAATLTPGDPTAELNYGCVVCGDRGWADVIVNLILFMPLGVGLACAGVTTKRAILVGTLASAVVELTQLALPGRDPSVGDVLFNASGTAMGIGLVLLTRAVGALAAPRAARFSMAVGLAIGGVVAATGWLLEPSFPRDVYWAQWTPNLGHLEWYRGRVRRATLGGRPTRSRRLGDPEWARRALLAGAPIEVKAETGPAVPALASLYSIYDEHRREIVLLGPDRSDFVFRYRTRSLAARLDQPDLRIVGGWPPLPVGEPIEVRVARERPGEWCLSGPRETRCGLGFTPGSAWGILYYVESFPVWFRALLSAGWVAGLLFPLGVLARRRWETAAALGVSAGALALVPRAVHLLPTPGLEWAGALGGLLTGLLAGGLLRAWVRGRA